MQYRVLAEDSRHRHELLVKQSRFIAVLQRVSDESAVRDLLAGLRREFRDARHFCSAYLLGPDQEIQRSNDDGEPAGTAGAPMLDVLRQRPDPAGRPDTPGQPALSDVCVVVIRYFGGTLLGTGGLIRAYSDAVSGVLGTARTIPRTRFSVYRLTVPHAVAGRYQHELSRAGCRLGEARYADAASLEVAIETGGSAELRLRELVAAADRSMAASTILQPVGTRWIDG